jgi:transcriptional regulator with XRE-family HTH domain
LRLILRTPEDVGNALRDRLRQRRLALNLSQATVAERSGINVHSLRRFERTGLIAFDSLLKIALVLGVLEDFDRVASTELVPEETRSLDEILAAGRSRIRGRST